jgi:AbrB family looped-hinge helix DNA binding protein
VESDRLIVATVKVHGKGRIQIPKDIRQILNISDGERLYFIQDSSGKIFVEKAPQIKKGLGKYLVTK